LSRHRGLRRARAPAPRRELHQRERPRATRRHPACGGSAARVLRARGVDARLVPAMRRRRDADLRAALRSLRGGAVFSWRRLRRMIAAMAISIERVHAKLGARITGVDLAQPLEDVAFRTIFEAFNEDSVLV